MPHALPPDHPDSAASPFAPFQPAAGVVADDVPEWQNPAGGPDATTVSKELAPVLAKEREQSTKDAQKAAEDAQKQQAQHAEQFDPTATVEVKDGTVTASKSSSSSSKS